MYIILSITWEVVIEDRFHIVNVNSPGCDICRYEKLKLVLTEAAHDALAHRL